MKYYEDQRERVNIEVILNKLSIVGIPKVYYFGEEGGSYIIVMELLADNVEEIFTK